MNKIDLLEAGERRGLQVQSGGSGTFAVSALDGMGIPALLAGFEAAVTRGNIAASLSLKAEDGEGLAFAYRHARVTERRDRAGKVNLSLKISPQERARFENRFGGKILFQEGIVANG
ncbi:MAG: hypothetical protein JO256_05540 [Alphaproteobacteria bacterium]|nr:hypothetical protein [Alphaproteobacteria bacterium]